MRQRQGRKTHEHIGFFLQVGVQTISATNDENNVTTVLLPLFHIAGQLYGGKILPMLVQRDDTGIFGRRTGFSLLLQP